MFVVNTFGGCGVLGRRRTCFSYMVKSLKEDEFIIRMADMTRTREGMGLLVLTNQRLLLVLRTSKFQLTEVCSTHTSCLVNADHVSLILGCSITHVLPLIT